MLNSYRDAVMDVCNQKGWHISSIEQVWLLLTEEIGELAGAIRRQNNQFCDKKITKVEDELGDVFSYLFQIAGMLNIDLNAMWEHNIEKSLNKKYVGSQRKHNGFQVKKRNLRECKHFQVRPASANPLHFRNNNVYLY